MSSWRDRPLIGVDTETTGTDVESARVVTACVVRWGGWMPTVSRTWLSDVGGEEIPAEATAIHGVGTEAARAAGRPAPEVIVELVTILVEQVRAGMPLVAMNAAFDFTVLDRECARYGIPSLFDVVEPRIIDPHVLDKRVDRYRKGGRRLADLCRHYRVPLENAHEAEADAVAACGVAWEIGGRYPWIGNRHPDRLHTDQAKWARDQAEGLRDWFAASSDPEKAALAPGVRLDWPFIPRPRTDAEGEE
ncbi:exonuclease domain-containing protein [Streptomyces sp. NPDC001552]|uniref:exonuclease domain-containing protein n=1 Tax=Streptomyces sp. NPDC001552 TaxID=3364587 RepID=UPI00367F1F1E